MSERRRGRRGTGYLYQRGNTWWMQFHVDGKPVRESTGQTNETAARNVLNRKLGEVAGGTYRPVDSRQVTVGNLLDLVVRDYEVRRKRSAYDARKRIDAHLRLVLGHVRANQFATRHVDGYIETRRGEKWRGKETSDSTIQRELAILRHAFSLGVKNEPPLVNRKPHIPALRADNVRVGFIEDAEYQRLLIELPAHLQALFVVGYHCGTRLGTLRELVWEQVDLSANEIRIRAEQTKQAKPQTIPIYGDMKRWLKQEWEDHSENWPDVPYVFHFGSKPIGAHVKGWRDACKRAELPDLMFHDLRRSAVRNMTRAGVSETVAMRITGHQTTSMYKRYDIVSGADIADAGRMLELRQEDQRKREKKKQTPSGKALRTGPRGAKRARRLDTV